MSLPHWDAVMAVSSTIQEFLEYLRQSGVVDEKSFTAYLQKHGGALPENPARAATQLVRDGVLTLFQAGQLLKGKIGRAHV